MWLPLESLDAFNIALVNLEQKLLALFRKSYPLESFLEDEDLMTIWDLVDENPYQAFLLARIKSSHAMTPRHAINVMLMARSWAFVKHKLGSKLKDFSLAALFHDLGHWEKPNLVYVFDHFTHEQYREMREHPVLPEDAHVILGESAATWILQHHEQPNGKGYPYGLRGNELELLGQALRVIDCYDGLTTARRFRPRYTPHEAMVLMEKWMGTRIHQGLFKSFKKFLGAYPVGTFVVLDDGSRGVTLPPNEHGETQVLQLLNQEGDRLQKPEVLAISPQTIQGESPSWHRPELPDEWVHLRPDLLDLPRAY